jgi:hypothetical protein
MPQKIGMVMIFNKKAIKSSLPPAPINNNRYAAPAINNRGISMTAIIRQPAGTCAPCGH